MKEPEAGKEVVKKVVTTPWKPASMLSVVGKDPNYRYRWVRKDLLDKRLEEGWEPVVASAKSRLEAPESTTVDGTPITTYTIKRGLILCRMPEETALARTAYYKKMSDGALPRVVEKLQEDTNMGDGKGPLAYGNITIGRPSS